MQELVLGGLLQEGALTTFSEVLHAGADSGLILVDLRELNIFGRRMLLQRQFMARNLVLSLLR